MNLTENTEANTRKSPQQADQKVEVTSVHDAQGCLLSVSPKIADLIGWNPGDLIGRDLFDLIPEKDKVHLEQLTRTTERFPQRWVRHRIECADGSHVWVETKKQTRTSSEKGVQIICATRPADTRIRNDLTDRDHTATDSNGDLTPKQLRSTNYHAETVLKQLFRNLIELKGGCDAELLIAPRATEDFPALEASPICRSFDAARLSSRVREVAKQTASKERIYETISSGRQFLGVPVFYDRRVIACLCLIDDEIDDSAEFANTAKSMVSQAETALECLAMCDQIKEEVRYDDLTSALNRGYFSDLAEREVSAADRYDFPVTLMMIDLDHFKNINDEYGHLVGDQVLSIISQRIHNNLRKVDLFGRYGGEEFVVMLPHTGLTEARECVASRIREAIQGNPISTDQGDVEVTASIGVAEYTADMNGFKTLIARADEALYVAKNEGRNQVALPVDQNIEDSVGDSELSDRVVDFETISG